MMKRQLVVCAVSAVVLASAFGAPRPKRAKGDAMMPIAPVEIGGAGELVASEATAAGDESEVVRVKGKGCGATEEAALKDAYRDAVESAVGLYMDAEQMVKNDELIKDQILTQSNAYIENYEVKNKNVSDGLVTITIWAQVRKRALTKRIEGMMPAKTYVVGDSLKRFHAQTVTQEKRSGDGAALLENELSRINPMPSLVDITLASEGFPVEADGRRKGRRTSDPNLVDVDYLFKVGINWNRYFEEIVPVLVNIFSQVSVAEAKEVSCVATRATADDPYFVRPDNRGKYVTHDHSYYKGFGNYRISTPDGNVATGTVTGPGRMRDTKVVVITKMNSSLTVVKGVLFTLDEASANVYDKWIKKQRTAFGGDGNVRFNAQVPQCLMSFQDAEGEDLAQTVVGMLPAGFVNIFGTHLISPLMGYQIGYYAWKRVQIPKSALPMIKSIKVELAK